VGSPGLLYCGSVTADDARSFSPELFRFLSELAANNEREWFNANKQRYVDQVREPSLAFIEDAEHRLDQISPHFRGSLYRIYRDTRFSKDKTPYKTHAGIHFRHVRHRDAHAPGFYLHLEPGQVFLGAGVWRPDRDALHAVRTAIARNPDGWLGVKRDLDRFVLSGESLKRPPAGFDRDHPLIEDLRRKSFVVVAGLTQRAATSRGFLEVFEQHSREAGPFVRFLCDALAVEF
jgi:uncharacterized protein (TIGR02453 family)